MIKWLLLDSFTEQPTALCQGGKHLCAPCLPPSSSVQKLINKSNCLDQHHNHKMRNDKGALLGTWLQLRNVCCVLSGAGPEPFHILDKNCLTEYEFKFRRGLWNTSLFGSSCRSGLGCWIQNGFSLGYVLLGSSRPRSTGRLMKDWVSLPGDRQPLPNWVSVSLHLDSLTAKRESLLLSFLFKGAILRGGTMCLCCSPYNGILLWVGTSWC